MFSYNNNVFFSANSSVLWECVYGNVCLYANEVKNPMPMLTEWGAYLPPYYVGSFYKKKL